MPSKIIPWEYSVFTPEVCQAMGDAFDAVCDELRARQGLSFDPHEIARRIIALARNGEKSAATMASLVLGPPPATLH
jgi:hypothetical protein